MMNFIEIARKGFDEWAAKPHNKKWFKKIDGTPIPNDVMVCIARAFSEAMPKKDPDLEADVWRVLINDNGRRMYVYTEALPYTPLTTDSGIKILSDPEPLYTDGFPQPDRNRKDKEPCGECHIKPGEICDVCGAAGVETKVTPSCGCVFRDLEVPCKNPQCEICHDLPQAFISVPAGIAELVARHTTYDDSAGVSTRMGDLRAVVAAAKSAPEAISVQDPKMILAGIRQFGLASDGSDLRDLEAAIEALSTSSQSGDLGKETLDEAEDRVMQDYRWGNLTKLGVANHLRRAGFNIVTAQAKANALSSPTEGAVKINQEDVLSRISVFRDMEPEEDETWISWYQAAFDMLGAEVRKMSADLWDHPAWQTIDGAPKDGTRVLVSAPGHLTMIAAWLENVVTYMPPRWWSNGAPIIPEPTHWRPLPAPQGGR